MAQHRSAVVQSGIGIQGQTLISKCTAPTSSIVQRRGLVVVSNSAFRRDADRGGREPTLLWNHFTHNRVLSVNG
jgi:hypothetical protein